MDADIGAGAAERSVNRAAAAGVGPPLSSRGCGHGHFFARIGSGLGGPPCRQQHTRR
jgi:hypothetical protein